MNRSSVAFNARHEFVEDRCAKFYAAKYGRPWLTPGIYFRSLLIGLLRGHWGGASHRLALGGLIMPEKIQKGRRNWQGKAEEQRAVYANRRRWMSRTGA